MTIMTIRIPDDVKEAFDRAYEGRDKDAVIASLIQRDLEERTQAAPVKGEAPKRDLIAEFRRLRASMAPNSSLSQSSGRTGLPRCCRSLR